MGCYYFACDMRAVCCGLFAYHICAIAKLCSVIVFLPGHLHCFVSIENILILTSLIKKVCFVHLRIMPYTIKELFFSEQFYDKFF